mmetsp:Transcript_24070/g.62014  ORF Transcript_24070/g.62014 Transcript_24070/m.62014 type:complete len:213 (+) Transcript_24070:93-731(+)
MGHARRGTRARREPVLLLLCDLVHVLVVWAWCIRARGRETKLAPPAHRADPVPELRRHLLLVLPAAPGRRERPTLRSAHNRRSGPHEQARDHDAGDVLPRSLCRVHADPPEAVLSDGARRMGCVPAQRGHPVRTALLAGRASLSCGVGVVCRVDSLPLPLWHVYGHHDRRQRAHLEDPPLGLPLLALCADRGCRAIPSCPEGGGEGAPAQNR